MQGTLPISPVIGSATTSALVACSGSVSHSTGSIGQSSVVVAAEDAISALIISAPVGPSDASIGSASAALVDLAVVDGSYTPSPVGLTLSVALGSDGSSAAHGLGLSTTISTGIIGGAPAAKVFSVADSPGLTAPVVGTLSGSSTLLESSSNVAAAAPSSISLLSGDNPSVKPPSNPSANVTEPSPTSDLPWATKFKASLRNLKKMSSPTFMEDGTPVVIAPPSVLLKTAELWKGHVVAQFHGLCPSANRIFSDLNPIWGNFGDITIRIVSDTVALIFIPAVNTRLWVTDIGFWQAGNCSCTVYPWSPEGLRDIKELKSAPTWAVLKNVPPQLYSLEGISVIASGIGEPLHTEKSRLDPISIGSTKVKVIINLDTPLPSAIVIRDIQGNSSRVAVEYPRPPPKCLNCGKYGHLLSRCPLPLSQKLPFKKDLPSGSKEVLHSSTFLAGAPATLSFSAPVMTGDGVDAKIKPKKRRSRSRSLKRSKSTPPRIAGSLDTLQLVQTSIRKKENSRKWVPKSIVDLSASLPINSPITIDSEIPSLKASKPERSMRDSIKDPDPEFPLPTG